MRMISANVELSNNIDVYVHLKINKGVIKLLLVKSNFILNNNSKMDKFKYLIAGVY